MIRWWNEWNELKRIGKKKWDYFYNKVIRFIIFAIISKIEFGYNVYRGIKEKKKRKKSVSSLPY